MMEHAPLVQQYMVEAIGDLRYAADEHRFDLSRVIGKAVQGCPPWSANSAVP